MPGLSGPSLTPRGLKSKLPFRKRLKLVTNTCLMCGRNDLGRATLTVLPVGYSQNGYSKKEFYVIITRKITRVSNFPRILGNYTHVQTVVTRRSFFPSHQRPGYEATTCIY